MGESSSDASSADMPSAGDVLKARENESVSGQNDRIKKSTKGKKDLFEVLKDIVYS